MPPLINAIRSWTGDMEVGLHQASPERCKEVGLQRPQIKSAGTVSVAIEDPYRKPPPFETLIGDLAGAYLRRINIQHRLVYQVLDDERVVKVLRLWSHYE